MLVIDITASRNHRISTVGVVRTYPLGDVEDTQMCVYEFGRVYKGKIKRPMGEIEHVYGDGAEKLAARVMIEVSKSDISAIHEQNYERLIDILEIENKVYTGRKIDNGE